jgi:hypothetical protein
MRSNCCGTSNAAAQPCDDLARVIQRYAVDIDAHVAATVVRNHPDLASAIGEPAKPRRKLLSAAAGLAICLQRQAQFCIVEGTHSAM